VSLLNAPDTAFVDWLIVGRPEPVIEAVMAAFRSRSDWDVMSLSSLPASSATAKALPAWLAGRYRWQPLSPLHSPYLTTTGSWEQFWTSTSQRFKKTVRNVRNRLGKTGTVSVAEPRAADPAPAGCEDLVSDSRR